MTNDRKPCRLYSDFNCPFCYAMHERLHALGVMAQISWCGVQHAPHLPQPMASWAGHLQAELKQEVEMVRRLAPELSISLPAGKPNTRLAITASARALRMDSARAGAFIRSLYRLFWMHGSDLSDERLLRLEAERHGFGGTELLGSAAPPVGPVLREWRDRWEETDHQGVPLLQRADQQVLVGLVPSAALTHFLAGL
ncbi:MAG: DSBA domain-containing protein [Nitrospira sp.]|nr:DsbA family protein [Nitrospira sp.]ULA58818.1 MAG: DSBA domain-containing protein [Nitrospira sp.]